MQSMKRKLIVGNWKMNGSLHSALELVDKIITNYPADTAHSYVICPPSIYLKELSKALNKKLIKLGAQDVSEYENGAYTGQISAQMLKEVGCEYVIIGHSERRQFCAESDSAIARKFLAALAQNITPILCVGESLSAREANQTEEVVLGQISAVIDQIGAEKFALGIIAYEPIWAIGTGKTASPEEAQAVHAAIRKLLVAKLGEVFAKKMVILYGGSVKASNSASLFKMQDIDGALVGGASLDAKDFLGIGEAAKIV
jgi:triosephosphate isomerase